MFFGCVGVVGFGGWGVVFVVFGGGGVVYSVVLLVSSWLGWWREQAEYSSTRTGRELKRLISGL